MADNKKAFVLYADLIHTVSKMPNDKAGELFKHILSYVNDEDPQTEDLIIQLTFEPIKQQLKRDLKKYTQIKSKRSDAGKRSAELRALKKEQQNQQNPTSVESVEQSSTNPTVTDTVTDTVKEKVTVKDIIKDINTRKADFKKSLYPFLEIYNKEMVIDFFEYWSEHGEKDRKFRKEKQKSFNIELRLKTWLKNSKRFEKEKSFGQKEKVNSKKNAGQLLQEVKNGLHNVK